MQYTIEFDDDLDSPALRQELNRVTALALQAARERFYSKGQIFGRGQRQRRERNGRPPLQAGCRVREELREETVKITSIDSAAPTYRGCRHNVIWLNVSPEGETEQALMRVLAGHVGKIAIYNDGNAVIEFRPVRRKH